jgi:SAM-dependent methyltransferase
VIEGAKLALDERDVADSLAHCPCDAAHDPRVGGMANSLVSGATSRPQFVQRVWQNAPEPLRQWALAMRYGAASKHQWMRETMNREAADFFRSLPPESHDVVEVSGQLRSDLPWRSYATLEYPEFDICGSAPPKGTYDVVICEQVLEHVPDPSLALTNLHSLCRPGGALFVSTPFLVRIHDMPGDYWRFTPDGLRLLVERAGMTVEWVHSWGNRSCVRRNLGRWVPYRQWRSLKNEKECPVMVWALARRAT